MKISRRKIHSNQSQKEKKRQLTIQHTFTLTILVKWGIESYFVNLIFKIIIANILNGNRLDNSP